MKTTSSNCFVALKLTPMYSKKSECFMQHQTKVAAAAQPLSPAVSSASSPSR